MKSFTRFKFPFAILSALAFVATATAQSASDVFKSDAKIIWTGVDFTKTKIIGEIGTVSSAEILPLYDKINGVIVAEPAKYNFAQALSKTSVEFDLGGVGKANSKINPDNIISMSSSSVPEISADYIAQSVKSYSLEIKEGIGLVIFMKALDKTKETGFMDLAFYDIKTRKVLFTETITGRAQGFGFRNHWAYTVYDVIKQIKKERYAAWKSKYEK